MPHMHVYGFVFGGFILVPARKVLMSHLNLLKKATIDTCSPACHSEAFGKYHGSTNVQMTVPLLQGSEERAMF